jgi:phosphotriesterase-related protein
MAKKELVGNIQTVTGLIAPEALGPTLMHEHILWDVTRPEVVKDAAQNNSPEITITLQNVWEINRRSILDYGNQSNRKYSIALEELSILREDCDNVAIVDLTNFGIQPDPNGLRFLSQGTGIPIIQGAGYYVDEYIPEEMKDTSVDDLATEITEQVTVGCWNTDIRAGIIGEIGCMWPLRPFERKVLQAAALAQQETGASINVHPGRHPDAPFEIVNVIESMGGDVNRLVMSHIDRTFQSIDDVLRLADLGCVIEYDFFGIETSYYWFNDTDLPTDYMRLRYIRSLIEKGFGRQIVVSQDICSKTRLSTFGGHGYGHLIRNVVPLMQRKEFTEFEIHTIFEETPRRLLTFV